MTESPTLFDDDIVRLRNTHHVAEIANRPHARTSDPDTSQAAAGAVETVEGKTSRLKPYTVKHTALTQFRLRPSTALEVERRSGQRGIWKRVSDLKNAELIFDTGERRLDPQTHRDGIVWQLTDRGRTVLDRLDAGEVVTL